MAAMSRRPSSRSTRRPPSSSTTARCARCLCGDPAAARYASGGEDPDVTFWTKGEEALFAVAGQLERTCKAEPAPR
jgi:hypothetical protein